jgi:hypothetical protein
VKKKDKETRCQNKKLQPSKFWLQIQGNSKTVLQESEELNEKS